MPLRYAMTPGELATLYREALAIDCELTIVELEGWRRDWLDATGLPFVPPSPALRTLEACALYAGTVLFEATALSEGRGTAEPFTWIGAPWLDAPAVARVVDATACGVRLEVETRRPRSGRFAGEDCAGLRLRIADRGRLRPVAVAVGLLAGVRDAQGERLGVDAPRLDRLSGTDAFRRALAAGTAASAIVVGWEAELASFGNLRRRHLRYFRTN